jgi:hypothetical protein
MALRGDTIEFKERKLYTGLVDFDIVGINPTAQELSELQGRDVDDITEPVYTTVDDDGEKLRLEIWLRNEELDLLTKTTFWLENNERFNRDGNKQEFINNVGNTAWAADEAGLSAYEWFNTDGVRPAMVGEGNLYSFLQIWSKIDVRKEGTEFILDTSWADLIAGDVDELNEYVGAFSTHQVRMLCGVTENNQKFYQAVYNNVVLRGGSNYVKYLRKALDNYAWKGDYQESFDLQVYTPTPASEQPAETMAQASTADIQDVLDD